MTLRSARVRFIQGLLIPTLLSIAAGCQTSPPIEQWQARLTDYIGREGAGDPNILRDSPALRSTNSLRPAQVQFAAKDLPGAGLFSSTRDVQGVLVGVIGEPTARWFVFLTGLNERDASGHLRVTDIRPIAMRVDGDQIHWCVGSRDPDAMHQYDSALGKERRLRLRRAKGHDSFPRLDDAFELKIDSAELVIHELKSGASWRIAMRGNAKS